MPDIRCTLLAAALLVATQAAQAQRAITLYGGARAGSGFEQVTTPPTDADMEASAALSIGIDWPYDSARLYQLLLSHQRTSLQLVPTAPGAPSELPLRVSYVHFGGLYFFEGAVNRGPYVAGGLGLTHLSPNMTGTSSHTRASMNLGIGYHHPLGGTIALRTELRGYFTLIDSQGSFFCSGGCAVQVRGQLMTQVEGMVGLTLAF